MTIFIDQGQLKYTPNMVDYLRILGHTVIPLNQDPDLTFYGAHPYKVYCEIKKIGADFVTSLIHGRLANQLARARDDGYNVFYLLTYGELERQQETGFARKRQWLKGGKSRLIPIEKDLGNVSYSRLIQTLHTLMIKQGLMWLPSENERYMYDKVSELYAWWQNSPEEHMSDHTPFHSAYMTNNIPITVRVARELPNIGVKRAIEIGAKFGSVEDMIKANIHDWQQIPGIGEGTAKGIVSYPGWRKND